MVFFPLQFVCCLVAFTEEELTKLDSVLQGNFFLRPAADTPGDIQTVAACLFS